jgi:CRP/FNR family transcriptional regulator
MPTYLIKLTENLIRTKYNMKKSFTDQDEIIATLKKSQMFAGISDKGLLEISSFFNMVDFKNDQFIFMEGDPSDWLYVVSTKKIKMIKHSESGKDVIVEIKSPGELFCCAAVLDNKPYPESAQSKGASSAIKIRRRDLIKLIDMFPVLKAGITNYLNEKLTDAYDMLQHLSTEIVEKRIASVLLKLSEKAGIDDSDFRKINFPLTRKEIAEMVGSSTETCIRTMSKLQKQGIVKSSKGSILINEEALTKFMEQ